MLMPIRLPGPNMRSNLWCKRSGYPHAWLAVLLLAGLMPDAAQAQGSPAPEWERKYDRWSVALLPGGARCAMFGGTRGNAYRIQIAANRRAQPLAFLELIGSVGDEHVG